jgi:UDP-N-acetylmuramoyl-tripeptide--D-alanyl-D-alanine ligase
MNHPGEISPLASLVKPDVAIITTVTPAHLEFFTDEAGIADEKATIMDGLPVGGAVVLNRDNLHFERLRAHAETRGIRRIFTFGAHPDASVKLVAGNFNADGSRIVAAVAGQTSGYQLGTPGRHAALNSLAVLAAVAALGGDMDQAARDLADVKPPKGRGQPFTVTLPQGQITLIDDSYNASPAAVAAAMSTLATMAGSGRRIAVLGDMLELGPAGPILHAGLTAAIVEHGIDLVFTAGPLSRYLHDALPANLRGAHADDAASLLEPLLDALKEGDVVTVKGSLGSRMGDLVKALKSLDKERAE